MDDLSVLFRLARLGLALLPGSASPSTMCDICDDVMVDLLKGAEGLQSLPCSWACLKVPECVAMCNNVKDFSQNSSRFPCVAAGYCEADMADWDAQSPNLCHMAPVFRCLPSRLCARRRNGFRFSCVLKPGYGRWVGMRQAVSENFGALAAALWDQPRCGEPGAHPTYCIAKPRGLGAVADSAGKAHTHTYIYSGLPRPGPSCYHSSTCCGSTCEGSTYSLTAALLTLLLGALPGVRHAVDRARPRDPRGCSSWPQPCAVLLHTLCPSPSPHPRPN